MTASNYEMTQLDSIPGIACPCGTARRGFKEVDGAPASVHYVEISIDARTHYHKSMSEIYVVLECGADAQLELDGRIVGVRPMTAVWIKPGCRHRAVGRMKILNIAIPKFDPSDEWFD